MTGSRKEYHYSDPALEEVKAFVETREEQARERFRKGERKDLQKIVADNIGMACTFGLLIVIATTWFFIDVTVKNSMPFPFEGEHLLPTILSIIGHIVFVVVLLAIGFGMGNADPYKISNSGSDEGLIYFADELKRKMLEIDKKKGNK